jgi:hypothetical protein
MGERASGLNFLMGAPAIRAMPLVHDNSPAQPRLVGPVFFQNELVCDRLRSSNWPVMAQEEDSFAVRFPFVFQLIQSLTTHGVNAPGPVDGLTCLVREGEFGRCVIGR